MAEKSGDIASVKNWLVSIRPIHVLVIIGIAGGLYGLNYLKNSGITGIDRTDYKKVAERFLSDNPTVANKLGKVKSVKLMGSGGGKIKYCSFSVRGTDNNGMCQVTVQMNGEGQWYVKSATLSTGGGEYSIPVSREDEKRNLKIFGK